jgi:hypothetical protein
MTSLCWRTPVALWASLLFPLLIAPASVSAQTSTPEAPPAPQPWPNWHISAYADLAYILDFNFPENHSLAQPNDQ